MEKHEFGIMKKKPEVNEYYETYEPEKYNCIAIDDDFIEPIMVDLQRVDCYWHTIQRKEKGLAYHGITLIPPKSLEIFIGTLLFQNKDVYASLIDLAKEAKGNGKYIIHYGL